MLLFTTQIIRIIELINPHPTTLVRQSSSQGVPMEDALAFAMKDPRIASRATETKDCRENIGKYVSLAYLEAKQNQF